MYRIIQGRLSLNWYIQRGLEFRVATKPCAIVCRTKNKRIRFIRVISARLRLYIYT